MDQVPLHNLFQDHLKVRLGYLEQALAATEFDVLFISSGVPFTHYGDDHQAPFQAVPHFRHYCPMEGPHHILRLAPGRKPLLIRHAPVDFWFEPASMEGTSFWADEFEIVEAPTREAVWDRVGRPARAAYLGDEAPRAEAAGLRGNPDNLVNRLDWGRSYKSPYEIRCLEEATESGAKGFRAGHARFLAGGSELEIHHAIVQAVECLDHQLSGFPSIVALDPKGAFLHYGNKRSSRNGKVLLLDSGARVRGYGSDITRTSASPACDRRFVALMQGVQQLQQKMCMAMKPGIPFGQVHHLAHAELGSLLHASGILKTEPEEALALGLTRPFMPHGLGHFLGLVTHDVAGRLAGPDGTLLQPPLHYSALRLTRTLEPTQVTTVEPGLYFIPMLLRPYREGALASRFDWKLIDELTPLGGMRFEDDVVVTGTGVRNVTQEYLPF